LSIELRRAANRLESHADGIVSRHSFAFGPHYDPMNTRFGALVTHNDDVLARGAGFPEHPHRDLEIVTWVVSGALHHTDSSGGSATVRPGMVGRLSTGAGVRHSETNASSGETRYVQMWLLPDAEGLPAYETADVSAALESGAFVAVASGSQPAPVTVRCNATLLVARLPAGSSAAIPVAPLLHVFVARGDVVLSADNEQVQLLSEDAARISGGPDVQVEATADAEVLAWAMG
jgi:redox-sensitive bicupin YhaK (pirin superfamily)